MLEGKKFPKVKGRSLSGKEVIIPKDVEGEVVLVGVAFKRDAQEMLDSWTHYFDILCEGKKDIYELPVIEGSLWKIFSSFIDKGMKSGIPEERHDKVVTHYGDASDVKEKLEIEDETLGYVFLLDENGRILFKGEGYADKEGKEELLEHIKVVCTPEDLNQ
ncbi:MAG: hypothetical protein KGY66_04235 [Candidatus Thermoplasmatota archaeon]|nr:hypothetical protein [Candidatus Thermoplasmatota archaeon]MBS3790106.1 hypothetical protein [Candidatus Thermoplasmatota archaeon]